MALILQQQMNASVIQITQNLSQTHLQTVQALISAPRLYGQQPRNTLTSLPTYSAAMQPQHSPHAAHSENYFNTTDTPYHANGFSPSQSNPWFTSFCAASVPQPISSMPPYINSLVPHCGNGQSTQNQRRATARGSQNRHDNIPAAGASIPYIKNGPNAWREAVNQWETGGRGLRSALKDWQDEWFTGAMKKSMASRRAQRKLIANEYQR